MILKQILQDRSIDAISGRRVKVLAVVTVDIMAWVLLRPWLQSLRDAGFEVHIACAKGKYYDQLAAAGFIMHPIQMRRTFNPIAHIIPLIELCSLLRSEDFRAVNTHSPVAAALGRLAAAFSGVYPIIYTVHGFYFHDRMPSLVRGPMVSLEWLFGRWTDAFMFVSDEDRRTAQRLGICSTNAQACTISNGVDLDLFHPATHSAAEIELREHHGLKEGRPVVGIVGRIVKEKGYREFLDMAIALTQSGVDATYLVVGDSLPSDRDQFGPVLREQVKQAGLADRFVFTGMTDRVQDYLALMDVFVLPSYREGFPRSVLEAMATGLPVVATDIRGCREAVVEGVTGHIVPPRDAVRLRQAVESMLRDPDGRRAMGKNARQIACEKYDYREIAERFAGFFQQAMNSHSAAAELPAPPSLGRARSILVSVLATLASITGLYLLPDLLAILLLRGAGKVWTIVMLGDAPGCAIIGLLLGWRWAVMSYLCLSGGEALLFQTGVVGTQSLIWITNLVPTLIIIGRLLPLMLKGHNWRQKK